MSFDAAKKLGTSGQTKLDAKAYLREVRRRLHCPRTTKRAFMSQLEGSVSQYLEDHPAAKFSDLATAFGEPEEIANRFIEESNPKAIRHSLCIRKRVLWLVIAVAVVVCVLIGGISIYKMWRIRNVSDGFSVETIVEDNVSVPLDSIDEDNIWNY